MRPSSRRLFTRVGVGAAYRRDTCDTVLQAVLVDPTRISTWTLADLRRANVGRRIALRACLTCKPPPLLCVVQDLDDAS